jgi:hypothetical protein
MEKEIIMFMLLDELSKYNIPKNQITVIKKHIDKLNMDSLKNHKVNDIIYIIKHFFSRRFASKENLDVKEYLYMDMGNIPEHNSVEIANEFSLQELLENPNMLRLTINPKSLIKKGYLYLDSRYRYRDGDLTKMKWYVSTYGTNYDPNTTASSTSRIKNIMAIKMFPFKFPNTVGALNNFNRLYVNIIEFESQYSLINNQKYHFEYDITRDKTQTFNEATNNRELNRGATTIPATFNTRNSCNEIGKSESIFYFNIPIPSLDKLSLEFKTPDKILTLDNDIVYGTVSITRVGRVSVSLIINQPVYISSFDELIISNMTTTSTQANTLNFVKFMNNVTILVSNTTISSNITTILITIPFGTSNISSIQETTINNNQFPIFINSKRITTRLEIDYQ